VTCQLITGQSIETNLIGALACKLLFHAIGKTARIADRSPTTNVLGARDPQFSQTSHSPIAFCISCRFVPLNFLLRSSAQAARGLSEGLHRLPGNIMLSSGASVLAGSTTCLPGSVAFRAKRAAAFKKVASRWCMSLHRNVDTRRTSHLALGSPDQCLIVRQTSFAYSRGRATHLTIRRAQRRDAPPVRWP